MEFVSAVVLAHELEQMKMKGKVWAHSLVHALDYESSLVLV